MLKLVKNPAFESPVDIVSKRGPTKFRMEVDLRVLIKRSRKALLHVSSLETHLIVCNEHHDCSSSFGATTYLFLPCH